ncbi:hypothetical protein GCM10009527_090570 [Actinomadura nitritigenes]
MRKCALSEWRVCEKEMAGSVQAGWGPGASDHVPDGSRSPGTGGAGRSGRSGQRAACAAEACGNAGPARLGGRRTAQAGANGLVECTARSHESGYGRNRYGDTRPALENPAEGCGRDQR